MFDSILQTPTGVLPVMHEFVTNATDHSFSGDLSPQDFGAFLGTEQANVAVPTLAATDDAPKPPPPNK